MAKLILSPGTPFAREIDLRVGKLTLGRSPDNDIQINDATISSHHCEMNVSDISVSIRDLGSTNGSFVDGRPVEKALLQSGQSMRFGQVDVRFEFGEVSIVIPEQKAPEEQHSALLADGLFSCYNHLDRPGKYQCAECGSVFCQDCVRLLPRISGGALCFCPICSNSQCREVVIDQGKEKGKGAFGSWLQNTLRIPAGGKKKK